MQSENVDRFLAVIDEMFAKDEYFVPYVWAERQYRDDNYQMGSQSLLEDLFFDTLGDFLHKDQPDAIWHRRSGKEPWDYRYNDLEVSHKEAITPLFTESWKPGQGPNHVIPRIPTATFSHPITLVYTPKRAYTQVQVTSGIESALELKLIALNYTTIELSHVDNAPVIACERLEGKLKIIEVWTRAEWNRLDFLTLRKQLGVNKLSKREIFHLSSPKNLDLEFLKGLTELIITREDLQSGIYFLEKSTLVDVPLIANNKAHFPNKQTVSALMDSALCNQRYIRLPVWPTVFAKTATPDLYKIQKEQYDLLFSARGN